MRKLATLMVLCSSLANAEGKASLQIGAPKVSAAFDEKGFAAAIATARAALLACYANDARAPLADPAKATLAFKVPATGRAVEATVTSELPLNMRTCMTTAIQKVAFPKGKETLSVSYELTFSFSEVSGIVGVQGEGTGEGRAGLLDPKAVNPGAPTFRIEGLPKTSGGKLDPGIIRRIVKRNAPKLQYCYEKQLVVSPKLAGTLTASFTIGGDGLVSAASTAGIDDKELGACIVSVIRRLEFPKPTGGVAVQVTYPFEMKPPPAKKAPAAKAAAT